MKRDKIIKYSTATLYVVLYVIVATISCICSIDFFDISHNTLSSIVLAISFEIGSMGCLFGALTTLKNKNNALIWIVFFFLTAMQMMNNTYYSYAHAENFKDWAELFDLIDLEVITQKRIIAIISGCVLPLVSLSFVHLLVDLLKQDKLTPEEIQDNRNKLSSILNDRFGNMKKDDENEPNDEIIEEKTDIKEEVEKPKEFYAEELTEEQKELYGNDYDVNSSYKQASKAMKDALQTLENYENFKEDE